MSIYEAFNEPVLSSKYNYFDNKNKKILLILNNKYCARYK